MGAGASVPDKIDEATCKTLAGDKFDQAKFDELKDEEGNITKEQLMGLAPSEDVSAPAEAAPASAAEEPAAPAAEEAAEAAAAPSAAAEPVTVGLKEMPAAIEAAVASGLTPLIIDSSEDHKVDTFYSYASVSVMDAKMIGLKVAKKEQSQEDSLEEARKKLVFAMKKGIPLVISMQQASPPFSDWLNNDDAFPATEVFTNSGKSLAADGAPWADKLFKPEDTADTAGIAMANPDFSVIVTSFFDKDSYAEFLFDENMGLSKFDKSLFQVIIIAEE